MGKILGEVSVKN